MGVRTDICEGSTLPPGPHARQPWRTTRWRATYRCRRWPRSTATCCQRARRGERRGCTITLVFLRSPGSGSPSSGCTGPRSEGRRAQTHLSSTVSAHVPRQLLPPCCHRRSSHCLLLAARQSPACFRCPAPPPDTRRAAAWFVAYTCLFLPWMLLYLIGATWVQAATLQACRPARRPACGEVLLHLPHLHTSQAAPACWASRRMRS